MLGPLWLERKPLIVCNAYRGSALRGLVSVSACIRVGKALGSRAMRIVRSLEHSTDTSPAYLHGYHNHDMTDASANLDTRDHIRGRRLKLAHRRRRASSTIATRGPRPVWRVQQGSSTWESGRGRGAGEDNARWTAAEGAVSDGTDRHHWRHLPPRTEQKDGLIGFHGFWSNTRSGRSASFDLWRRVPHLSLSVMCSAACRADECSL